MSVTTIHLPAEVDIEQERAELYAALQNIQNLRHQHPYDAVGRAPGPAHAPIAAPTAAAQSVNTNANPNTKLTQEGPRIPARAPEMAV